MVYKIGNVLSLFDGISCLQVALNRAGIKYDNYYASEIDKNAIECTKYHYPNTIHLGDIRDIDFTKLPKIDLIAGGPPCQDFSIAGKRKGLDGRRGNLTFTFIDVIKKLKPKYWLMENVASMNKFTENEISKYIGCFPVKVNSNLVSAQNRNRLYWLSNSKYFMLPVDKNISFLDIWEGDKPDLYLKKTENRLNVIDYLRKQKINKKFVWGVLSHFEKGDNIWLRKLHIPKDNKFSTITKDFVHFRVVINLENEQIRQLTPLEYERLQTLPDNYTSMLSNNQRYSTVGNGWTIDIVVHLLHTILRNEEKLPKRWF
jgi:DNA-cytosine methyltransferase